jgi:hypothetical protein
MAWRRVNTAWFFFLREATIRVGREDGQQAALA